MKQHQKDIADLYRTVKRIPIPEADNPMMPKVSKIIDYMGGNNNQTLTESASAKKHILNSPEILTNFPWAR